MGYKFNVEVAVEKFQAMVEMRVKNNVDDLRAKFENVSRSCWFCGVSC